jgi:isoquinoline 1-oxidoreductase subunit beta
MDQIKDGRAGFIMPDGSTLGYGALVPAAEVIVTGDQLLADNALPRYALRSADKRQAIGQGWRHHELAEIVTGQMTYARDVSIPDMAFGAAIYLPAFGARFVKADPAKARAIPGVIGVDIDKGDGFVGIVAGNPFVLADAIAVLDAQWQIAEELTQSQIESRLDAEKFRSDDDFAHTLLSSGGLGVGRQTALHRVTGRYDTPFAAHAAIEPRSGLVWVRDDKVEVRCGTQDPYFAQKRVAKIVGREVDDVVVHTHRIGGGFGGRVPSQATEAAARLSAAFNRPVRVQWDRKTELQNNYFQPKSSHFIEAGVTDDGTISHWDHDVVSSSILTGLVPNFVGKAIDMAKADDGTVRGIVPQYDMLNRRIRHSAVRTPVPVNAWRGLGSDQMLLPLRV